MLDSLILTSNPAYAHNPDAATCTRRTCGVGGSHALSARCRNEKGMGRSSLGCASRPAYSIVRPSSRGGVPVLSRLSANPAASSVHASVPVT